MESDPSDRAPSRKPPAQEPSPEESGSSRAVTAPVVAIGASAGGVESLERLVARLQPVGVCVLVMQHFPPDKPSMLAQILARATPLRVEVMRDGAALVPDTIYVAPPHVQVQLERSHLRLSPLSASSRQHPVDVLFRSLALDQGADAIAVVLSGTGSDGAQGVRAVKDEGGITFAETPSSAAQPGMPQSALDSGCVDFALSAAAIGDELVRLVAEPHPARNHFVRRLGSDVLERILEQLKRAHGVDFTTYKSSTIERRILRRMRLQHQERPSEYVKLLESQRSEVNALYQDLLIGVTAFFRDREPFEALCNTVLPALLARRPPEQPLRVWVPGCATGEEAYSLAMCLLEQVENMRPQQRFQLFATDIDEQALKRARLGVYPESIEIDVSAQRLARFFTRVDNGNYQVVRKLRDMVVFARHNLGKDPPFSRLDLISCRNLLIYLQPPLQKRIMRVFHYALNPGGCLLLGTAESVGDASDLFSLVDRKLKIYLKKHSASAGVFDFTLATSQETGNAPMSGPPNERKPELSLQQLVDRKVLDKYGPPGIVMDDALNILQFRGQCAPYLAPSAGAATLNMLRMLRPELAVPLRATVQRVQSEGIAATTPPVQLGEANSAIVEIDVLPLETAPGARCVLALFREQPKAVAATDDPPTEPPRDGSAERVQTLERELLTTKDYLDTIIQELARSNEELQSSNEELQSSNEELQSTNEELETSKEEQQAANEELVTVNEELQTRISQLSVANDDVVNLLSNITSPVVLVGLDLRIRRFSTAAERLLSLIASDVGRPISYLGTVLSEPQIETSVGDAINTMRPRQLPVRCSNGAWYTLRAVPYQTADRAVRGAVIELLPFHALGTEFDGAELHQVAGQLLAALPFHAVLVDSNLRVLWANDSFLKWRNTGTELFGKTLDEAFGQAETDPELWKWANDTVRRAQSLGDHVARHANGASGEQKLRWRAQKMPSQSPRRGLTLFVLDELSTD